MKTNAKIYIAFAIVALSVTTIGFAYGMFGNPVGVAQNIRGYMGGRQEVSMNHGMHQSGSMNHGTGLGSHSGAAMQGYGRGQGKGLGMMNASDEECNTGTLIRDIAPSSLSDQEKLDLAYQYSEEMVARDMYTYFYSLYNIETFKNIAESEQKHMDAVQVLLDRYELRAPMNYGELTDSFSSLKAEGKKGLKEALEVGLKIEMLDVKDIVDTIKTTDNDDIKVVLVNIGGASYNHMRGFAKAIQANGLTTTVDYSSHITQAEVNTGGSLKSKLTEKLTAEGVKLPTQVMNQKNMGGHGKGHK